MKSKLSKSHKVKKSKGGRLEEVDKVLRVDWPGQTLRTRVILGRSQQLLRACFNYLVIIQECIQSMTVFIDTQCLFLISSNKITILSWEV